jgi:FMN phosphatase YigB (HAD superfamily)
MLSFGPTSELPATSLRAPVRAVCFDWGDTLMVDDGPAGVPMVDWSSVRAAPGARACLASLSGRVPVCVATNAAQSTREMIEGALDRVDLARYIDRIFCFTEIGVEKNRPEFWLAVSEALGLPPAEILMLGDSLEHDVLAPRAAGIQAAWFNTGGRHREPSTPVAEVTALASFAELVAPLLTPPEKEDRT